MTTKTNTSAISIMHHFTQKRWLIWSVAGIVAVIVVYYFLVRPMFASSNQQLVFYTVKRADLPITVTERGAIESQKNVKVLCEVSDIPDDGMRGTPILWIIPNGATVTKGTKIVEFESERHIERRDRQLITVSKAKSDKIEAEAKYKIQVIQNKLLLYGTRMKLTGFKHGPRNPKRKRGLKLRPSLTLRVGVQQPHAKYRKGEIGCRFGRLGNENVYRHQERHT